MNSCAQNHATFIARNHKLLRGEANFNSLIISNLNGNHCKIEFYIQS